MLRLDFKTVCARAKKLKPHIEISHDSRLEHSEIIDLSYRAKKDDCTMTDLIHSIKCEGLALIKIVILKGNCGGKHYFPERKLTYY